MAITVSTVQSARSGVRCNITARRRDSACGDQRSSALPSIMRSPLSGVRKPVSSRSRVDLPAPFGPISAVISPPRSVSETVNHLTLAEPQRQTLRPIVVIHGLVSPDEISTTGTTARRAGWSAAPPASPPARRRCAPGIGNQQQNRARQQRARDKPAVVRPSHIRIRCGTTSR